MSLTDYLFLIIVLRTAFCCLPTNLPGKPPSVGGPTKATLVPFVSTLVEDDVLNITLNYDGPVFKPFTVLLLRELLNGSRVVATTTVCDDRPSFMIKGLQPSKWYGLSVLSTFQRPKGRHRSLADYRAFDTSQSVNRTGRQKSKAASLQVEVALYKDLIEYKLYSRLAEHFPTLLELRPSCPLPGLPKRLYLDIDQNSVSINVTGLDDPDGLEVIGALLSQEENVHMQCQQLCWSASIESNSIVYKYDEDCQLLMPILLSDGTTGSSISTNVDASAGPVNSGDIESTNWTSGESSTSAGFGTTETLPGDSTDPRDGQSTEPAGVESATSSGVEPASSSVMESVQSSVIETSSVAESTISPEVVPGTSGVEPTESPSSESSSSASGEAEQTRSPLTETTEPSGAESTISSGLETTESPGMEPSPSTSGQTEFAGTELVELPGTETIEPSEVESTISGVEPTTLPTNERTESTGDEPRPPSEGEIGDETIKAPIDMPTESPVVEVSSTSEDEPVELLTASPVESSGVGASSGDEPTESSGAPTGGESPHPTEVELSDSAYPDYAELTEPQSAEPKQVETVQPEPATTPQTRGGASISALSTTLLLAVCLLWQPAPVESVQ